ncbi:MAG: hypothetical protein M3540_06725 [Actinomycetota bacterium]|nr:hypothetical protein [Actinomycetota bacterium]
MENLALMIRNALVLHVKQNAPQINDRSGCLINGFVQGRALSEHVELRATDEVLTAFTPTHRFGNRQVQDHHRAVLRVRLG